MKIYKTWRNYILHESPLKPYINKISFLLTFFIQSLGVFFDKINFTQMPKIEGGLKGSKGSKGSNVLWCSVCNDNYIPGLCVLLYSLKKHNPTFDYPFKIYYDDDISETNQAKVRAYYKNVIFEKSEVFKNYAKWYNCLLPFKETGYDKVICIDSDILCLGDISELNETDYTQFTACQDSNLKFMFQTHLNIRHFFDINSGIFIIPKTMLNNGVFQDLVNLAKKYAHEKLGDQDILNRYLKWSRTTRLPGKYNVKKNIYYNQNYKPSDDVRFLHFCGTDKPFLTRERTYIKTKNNLYLDGIYALYQSYMDEMGLEVCR
jgi:lipopolysaccharide biosynthesis glycosyltransferase